MHDAILIAALSIAAVYGAGASPAPDKSTLLRLAPPRPAIERTMGVIKPPVCIDLGMLKHIPDFSSAMPNDAFDPGAIENWKAEVARCKRGPKFEPRNLLRPAPKR